VVVVLSNTASVTADEALARNVAAPEYETVKASLPIGRVEVAIVATPPERVTVPSAVAPFLKVTVPVGVPEREATTEAFKVTACPLTAGLGDAASVVVVGDAIEKVVVRAGSVSPEPLTAQYLTV
jgi:hypothetical protein